MRNFTGNAVRVHPGCEKDLQPCMLAVQTWATHDEVSRVAYTGQQLLETAWYHPDAAEGGVNRFEERKHP